MSGGEGELVGEWRGGRVSGGGVSWWVSGGEGELVGEWRGG